MEGLRDIVKSILHMHNFPRDVELMVFEVFDTSFCVPEGRCRFGGFARRNYPRVENNVCCGESQDLAIESSKYSRDHFNYH